jgi:hypothetical protein
VRRPAALRRFPRLAVRPDAAPFISEADRARYPALADDFATLDATLTEPFCRLDAEALREQNTFLWGQVVLIAGTALAATAGAVHTALGGGVAVLGAGQAILTGALGVVATVVARRAARAAYIDKRLRAERLRAQYFLFLCRSGPYAEGDAAATLRREVQRLGGREARRGRS